MKISSQIAQMMISKAIEKATIEFKRPICVSVCDTDGLLIAFCRVEGGHARSVEMSQAKAYTAARMGVDTDALLERLQRENLSINYWCDPRMTPMPGGVVLKDATGAVIGGVGIAGLKSQEDLAIAHAVAEVIKGL